MNIQAFSTDYFDNLTQQAAASSRRRQHRNIHTDFADPCQRLFNAIEPDSYLPPHRHGAGQGNELMIAIRGLMVLVIFDEAGGIEQTLRLGAVSHQSSLPLAVGADIPPGKWHMVLSLEPGAILLEVKAGPYDPRVPKLIAAWAPDEGSPEAASYLNAIRQTVLKSTAAHSDTVEVG
jgi:cupin fold WbuC family metalloprotein